MSSDRDKRNHMTKEIALALTPIAAAYLFIAFYEAGFSGFYNIPIDLIKISFNDVLLTNRLTLMVAVLAFLWIGLYYNVLPSANSPVFKGVITMILILCLWLGFFFGQSDAAKKTEYLVTKTTDEMSEYVVLKIYGDTIVSAKLDRRTNSFQKQYKIHQAGDNPNLIYHLESIGPLKASSH